MQTLTKDISDIIINEAHLINEKLKGLNFLETLKLQLIEKIKSLVTSYKFPLDQSIEFEIQPEINLRTLIISINYYKNSIYISKKKIDHDSLLISFTETSNIDIFEGTNKNSIQSFFLYKNTGVSLSADTIINAKYKKDTLIIEIKNKDLVQILAI